MQIKKIFINRFTIFFALLAIGLNIMSIIMLDGWMGIIGRIGAQDSTICSEGFSDYKYRFIHNGMVKEDVVSRIGKPLFETWEYDNIDGNNNYIMLHIHNDVLKSFSKSLDFKKGSMPLKNYVGRSKDYILKMLGDPDIVHMNFCKRKYDTSYKVRSVEIKKGEVVGKRHYYYID